MRDYDASTLLDLAQYRDGDQAHLGAAGPDGEHTGVALPEWVQAGALLSPDRARTLGAQLLRAADLHDAIADAGAEPIRELYAMQTELYRSGVMLLQRLGELAAQDLSEADAAAIGAVQALLRKQAGA